jgi:TorA maturation chaperone TorD
MATATILKKRAEMAEGRANIYRFLTAFYIEEPTSELIEKVKDEVLLESLSEIFTQDSLKYLLGFSRESKDGIEDVKQEYSDLFIVPTDKCVTPYESVYKEGTMMQKPYVEVSCIYKQAGIEFSKQDGRLTADHIGIELDFMRVLCEKEAECWQSKDESAAKLYVGFEKGFLKDHLNTWLEEFCKKMENMAELDLYKGIAGITFEHVTRDYKTVKELAKEISADGESKSTGMN